MKTTYSLMFLATLAPLATGCFTQAHAEETKTESSEKTATTSSILGLPAYNKNETEWLKALTASGYRVSRQDSKIVVESPEVLSDDKHGLLSRRWNEKVRWDLWIAGDQVVGSYTVFTKPPIGSWDVKSDGGAVAFKP